MWGKEEEINRGRKLTFVACRVSSQELSWIFMATQKKRDWINEPPFHLLMFSANGSLSPSLSLSVLHSLFTSPLSLSFLFILSVLSPKWLIKLIITTGARVLFTTQTIVDDAVPCYCNLFLPFLVYHHTKPFILFFPFFPCFTSPLTFYSLSLFP